MSDKNVTVHLKVWRQDGPNSPGGFKEYRDVTVPTAASFLEMLDVLNERLVEKGEVPITFEHDCREGICGTCGFVINGQPHGQERGTTVCQLHMRLFNDGDTLVLEPWRATAFPIIKDLAVDRTSLDAIQRAGGYNSTNCGNAPDANAMPVGTEIASQAFDAATCIGCGACVAACPNASAMLFTGAKISHLGLLPQGQPERKRRALRMVHTHDEQGFGGCSNTLECEAACPKEISTQWIQRANRDFMRATFGSDENA